MRYRRDRGSSAALMIRIQSARRAGDHDTADVAQKFFDQKVSADKRQRGPVRGRKAVIS